MEAWCTHVLWSLASIHRATATVGRHEMEGLAEEPRARMETMQAVLYIQTMMPQWVWAPWEYKGDEWFASSERQRASCPAMSTSGSTAPRSRASD